MNRLPWVVACVAILATVAVQWRCEHRLAEEREGWNRTYRFHLRLAADFGREMAEAQVAVGHGTYLYVGMPPIDGTYRGYTNCPLGMGHGMSPETCQTAFITAYNAFLDGCPEHLDNVPGSEGVSDHAP